MIKVKKTYKGDVTGIVKGKLPELIAEIGWILHDLLEHIPCEVEAKVLANICIRSVTVSRKREFDWNTFIERLNEFRSSEVKDNG